MNNLLNLDLFGVSPSFFIANKRNFKSYIGVYFSLLCLAIIVVSFFLLGKDFYLKETPRVITEQYYSNAYSNSTFANSNFTFAYRIEDDNGNAFNASFLNIQLAYTQYYLVDGNFIMTDNKINISNLCSNINFDNQLLKNINETNCLYFSSPITLGGSWSSNYISKINIDIVNNHANNISFISNYLANNDLYFTFYYPQYFTIPSDYNDPLRIRYSSYYYLLSANTGKMDRINIRSFFFNADNGWIFKTSNITEVYGLDSIISDFYKIDYSTDFIYYYSAVLYYQSDYQVMRRSYMKIQELVAAIGGVIKIILVIMQMFMFLYNSFYMEMSLIKFFFDSDNINDKELKCEMMELEKDFNKEKYSKVKEQ